MRSWAYMLAWALESFDAVFISWMLAIWGRIYAIWIKEYHSFRRHGRRSPLDCTLTVAASRRYIRYNSAFAHLYFTRTPLLNLVCTASVR